MKDDLSYHNPAAGIFDHKWLDSACVLHGCRSLLVEAAADIARKHAQNNADLGNVAKLAGRLDEADKHFHRANTAREIEDEIRALITPRPELAA